AANGGGNVSVEQAEAVVAMSGIRPGGKARLVQHGIEEVAGAVTGKGAAGAVGSVGAGSEAEDQQASVRIAEAGNRPGPVIPLEIGAALFLPDLSAVGDEARAAGAGDNLRVQAEQFGAGSGILRNGPAWAG